MTYNSTKEPRLKDRFKEDFRRKDLFQTLKREFNELTQYFLGDEKKNEFLYDCVNDTLRNIIPNEVKYIQKYDEFKTFIDNEFEMPDNLVSLLVRFLEQNNGIISKRGRNKEFESLSDNEVLIIENKFREIFLNNEII